MADALEQAQVDESVDQRVAVDDRLPIARVRPFDAEGLSLAVEALGRGALAIGVLVVRGLAVEGIAQARPDTGGHRGHTAALGPALVVDGTGPQSGKRRACGQPYLARSCS